MRVLILPGGSNSRTNLEYAILEQPLGLSQSLKYPSGSTHPTSSVNIIHDVTYHTIKIVYVSFWKPLDQKEVLKK